MQKILLVAVAAIVGASAQAAVLHDNGYLDPNGFFSDSLASNGSFFYAQTVSDNFSLSGASTLTSIVFRGSSENFVFDDLTNMSSFEINIFDSTGTNNLYSATVATGALSAVATGNINVLDGIEFEMTHGLSLNLAAGNYFLNIGANLISGGDDAWAWSNGLADGTSTINNFDNLGFVALTGDQAFVINGEAVPEPATMFALGAGALALARRRRNKN